MFYIWKHTPSEMQQATQKNISKEDLLRVWKRKRESKPTSLPLSGLRVQGDCWEPGRRAAEVYEIITTERYWSFWWVGRWKTFWQLGQWWSCGGKAPPTRPQGPFRSALFLGFTLNFSRTPPCPFRPPLPPPQPLLHLSDTRHVNTNTDIQQCVHQD